jgi:long-chain acyl-CoA synthetase
MDASAPGPATAPRRPWLAQYPPDVPAEIDAAALQTIPALLADSVARYGPRPAYACFGHTLSFSALDKASRDVAAWLQAAGLKPGERVALMLPNVLPYPVALFGLLRAGLVAVNVNPLYSARELRQQMADSGAAAIVILESFAHTLQAVRTALPALRVVIVAALGDMAGPLRGALINAVVRHVQRRVPPWKLPGARRWSEVLREGAALAFTPPPLVLDDAACLQYTGGTTGVSKGAVLSHRNLAANMLQIRAWLGATLRPGEEVVLTPLPLYHVFSFTCNGLLFMHLGGLCVLVPNPRDLPGLLRIWRRWPVTVIAGINTLFTRLLDEPGFMHLDFSRLKLAVGGGMAVQRTVAERWTRITGGCILEGYGLTEAAPVVCANPRSTLAWDGTVGLPLPSTAVEVRDEEGHSLPPGQAGELWLRGPQVMRGYWRQPEETAQVLSSEGWLRTGDVAVMDAAGRVRIVDRIKDMIVVSGFKVFPNEVEDVLTLHPAVREAACVGEPDAVAGEVVRAYVVLRDGQTATAGELLAHCRAQLTAYKRPRSITIRDELPKSPVGKVLRKALRQEMAENCGT